MVASGRSPQVCVLPAARLEKLPPGGDVPKPEAPAHAASPLETTPQT
jgi:hypothetical protein